MRKLKPKYKTLFIGMGIFMYMLIALSFSGSRANEQRCTNIEVEVLDSVLNRFVSSEDIEKILEENEINIMGYPLNEINTYLIESQVEKHSSIENAEVFINLKGSLKVKIIQRQPLVRIFPKSRSGYYIDKNGLLMPLSKNFTSRVPIVTGHIERNYQDFKMQNLCNSTSDSLLSSVFLLSQALDNDEYWSAMSDQIYVSENNDLILIPKIGAKEIILGQNRKFAEDLKILSTFYKEVLPVIGWEKYRTINLQYKQQIVCK